MLIRDDKDTFDLFAEWYAAAADSGLDEPTAVNLATADAAGRPSTRMVLLKGYGDKGFVFYTNLGNLFSFSCSKFNPLGLDSKLTFPLKKNY